MRTNLRRDLTAALKNRDRVAIAALRSALAAIENAEAPPAGHQPNAVEGEYIAGSAAGAGATDVERRDLTEADLHAIVAKEAHDRSVAAEEYEQIGRNDIAQRLQSEADVLGRYLARD